MVQEHVLESWRFTHNRDVVPSLPPSLIGFHHVAREVWQVGTTCALRSPTHLDRSQRP
jgi:hypothetical protein